MIRSVFFISICDFFPQLSSTFKHNTVMIQVTENGSGLTLEWSGTPQSILFCGFCSNPTILFLNMEHWDLFIFYLFLISIISDESIFLKGPQYRFCTKMSAVVKTLNNHDFKKNMDNFGFHNQCQTHIFTSICFPNKI